MFCVVLINNSKVVHNHFKTENTTNDMFYSVHPCQISYEYEHVHITSYHNEYLMNTILQRIHLKVGKLSLTLTDKE